MDNPFYKKIKFFDYTFQFSIPKSGNKKYKVLITDENGNKKTL
jgi:hypothetical protein